MDIIRQITVTGRGVIVVVGTDDFVLVDSGVVDGASFVVGDIVKVIGGVLVIVGAYAVTLAISAVLVIGVVVEIVRQFVAAVQVIGVVVIIGPDAVAFAIFVMIIIGVVLPTVTTVLVIVGEAVVVVPHDNVVVFPALVAMVNEEKFW